jgi:hypothetical protein
MYNNDPHSPSRSKTPLVEDDSDGNDRAPPAKRKKSSKREGRAQTAKAMDAVCTELEVLRKQSVVQSEMLHVFYQHNVYIVNELLHLKEELSWQLSRPTLRVHPPPPANVYQSPIPCPREPRQNPVRNMTPVERGVLSEQMRHIMTSEDKRNEMLFLIHGDAFPTECQREFLFDHRDEHPSEKLWALWHLAKNKLPLRDILSREEYTKYVTLKSKLSASLAAPQRVPVDLPLDGQLAKSREVAATAAAAADKRSAVELARFEAQAIVRAEKQRQEALKAAAAGAAGAAGAAVDTCPLVAAS